MEHALAKTIQAEKPADSRSVVREPARESSGAAHLMLLRRFLGNRALGLFLQAKLKVSAPGDHYEQEADRVAEQVMRMPDPARSRSYSNQPAEGQTEVMRAGKHIPTQPGGRTLPLHEEPRITRLVKRTPSDLAASFEPCADFESRLSTSGDGSPLPSSIRPFMEPRFGADFGAVRLHTGNEAAQLNRAIHAQAFTHGSHIYLGEGMSDIGSTAGKQLLAHELTHTIQQGGNVGRETQLREVRSQESRTTIMRSSLSQRDTDPNDLPQPFGKFLATAFMYGPFAAQLAKVTYVAKVTSSTAEVTVVGLGTFTYPVQVLRGDAGFYFVQNSSTDPSSVEVRRMADPADFLSPNPYVLNAPPPSLGPPLTRENQPLIRFKAGAVEEARLRRGRRAIVWLRASARIRQELAPPPAEKERELPLPTGFEMDAQLFRMAVQSLGSIKLSLLGLTGGLLNPGQYYDLPLNITYYTQDGMEAYVSRKIVNRDFFYSFPISHIVNFLRFYPLEEGAKSARKNEPLYRGIFDLGVSLIPVVGPLYGLFLAGVSIRSAYKNWEHMTGVEMALVGLGTLLAVVPFIRTARSLATGAAEFNSGREALITMGVPRADATRLMRASGFLNSEKASLQIVDALNDALKQGKRLSVQEAQQIRTILENMLTRIPAAEREALKALYATADSQTAEQFFGVRVTESQLQGLSRLNQGAIAYLKPLAKSRDYSGMFLEIADWAAKTNKVANGINRVADVAKNSSQFLDLIKELGEEMLSRVGAEGVSISEELKMFVKRASNGAEAYQRLMEGSIKRKPPIAGLREQLRFLYANKAELSPEAQTVQEFFPKVFLTANQLEGVARLTAESRALLANESEANLRALATAAARSTGAATGLDNLLLGLSPAFQKESITAADVINRIDSSLIEALGSQKITVSKELAKAAAKKNGPLDARQTLLNGTVVKGVKVPGLLDPLVGNLKSTAAADGLLKTIGDAKQKGSLFGAWAVSNEGALRAVRPSVADGIVLIKRLHPDNAADKISGIYERSPDQAFAYTVFEELAQFEKMHGREINLGTLVTELAASNEKAIGSTFTLSYTNRIPVGKIERFEFMAEKGLSGRERIYDLKAGGVEYEMKNWSGFGGRPANAAADEFARDAVRHAPTKFMGLRWVISSQARSSDVEIRSMMRSALLNKDVQAELLSHGIKYQQAYDALEEAFGRGLIEYF